MGFVMGVEGVEGVEGVVRGVRVCVWGGGGVV